MNWDSDPGEGTSDGRVKKQQLKPNESEIDIKEEIFIKDEPDDNIVVLSQKSTVEANDAIKIESESENDCEVENHDDLVKKEVKCEDECKKKKKLDSTKDESSGGHQADENPSVNKPTPNKRGKKPTRKRKVGNERRQNNKEVTSEKKTEKGQRKMHKCHLCNYKTSWKGDLTRHIRTHTGERPFECEVCANSFTQKSDLKRHQKVHVDQFPFNCKKCLNVFANEIDKVEHENKCNLRQYECHLCKYSTQIISNLKQHIRIHHTGIKTFGCRVCSKAFVTKFELGIHSQTHTKELPYDCSKCGQRFVDENVKQLHEQRCKARRYECYVCRYKCHNRSHLKQHMQYNHTGDKKFQCAICEMKFAQKWNLNRHLAIHSKKRPIRCSKCLRKFTQNDEKEQHEKYCTRRHYQCFMCKFIVRSLTILKVHIRAHHTGEKPFQCKMCGALFTGKCQLSTHIKHKHIAKR